MSTFMTAPRLTQFDANRRNQSLQRLLHDGGLGVSQNDEAFAFVAARGRLPRRGQLGVHDQRADVVLHLVQTMIAFTRPLPWPRKYAAPTAYRRGGAANSSNSMSRAH